RRPFRVGEVKPGAGGPRHRRRLRVQLQLSLLEAVHGGLVLQEHDLAIGLPAELEADGHLSQTALTNQLPTLVHKSIPMGATDADRTFADAGKDCIALRILEVLGQLWL